MYQPIQACLLPDSSAPFGTAVRSPGMRVSVTYCITYAYYCYNKLVKIKLKIRIKINFVLGLNRITCCQAYANLLATDASRLTYTLQHARQIDTAIAILKVA